MTQSNAPPWASYARVVTAKRRRDAARVLHDQRIAQQLAQAQTKQRTVPLRASQGSQSLGQHFTGYSCGKGLPVRGGKHSFAQVGVL
jgi:hypothetical protein